MTPEGEAVLRAWAMLAPGADGEAARDLFAALDEARADLESVWHATAEVLGDDRGMEAYTPADAQRTILRSVLGERDEARRAAIEECAAVCDEEAEACGSGQPNTRGCSRLLAGRIRALLDGKGVE
jgi:hypothetical protein